MDVFTVAGANLNPSATVGMLASLVRSESPRSSRANFSQKSREAVGNGHRNTDEARRTAAGRSPGQGSV